MYGYGDVDVNGVPLCVLDIGYALQYGINWQASAFYDRSSTNFDHSSEKLLTFSSYNCILYARKSAEYLLKNAFHSVFYTVCRISIDFCRNLRYYIMN